MKPSPRTILENRLQQPVGNLLNVRTTLQHFALINYALPKSRLEPHLPTDRFDIPEFVINGQPLAMLSAVPFVDADFRYARLAPGSDFVSAKPTTASTSSTSGPANRWSGSSAPPSARP